MMSWSLSRSWYWPVSPTSRRPAALFLGVGVAALAVGGALKLEDLRFSRGAVGATGSVVGLMPRVSDDGGRLWAPVIRFRDPASGEEIEITSNTASSPPAYAIGDEVGVLYRPGEPHRARIDDFLGRWFGSLVPLVLGVVFVGVGLLCLRAGPRRAPSPVTNMAE